MEIAKRALALSVDAEARYLAREDARRRARDAAERGDLWNVDTPERIRKRLDHIETISRTRPSSSVEAPAIDDFIARLSRERAIGRNDLVTRRYLDLALAAARSVGRITVRSPSGALLGYGTGWLVGPGVVLTNHHVLESQADSATSEITFGFDAEDAGAAVRVARLAPQRLFVTDAGLDFTFVGVAEADSVGRPLSDIDYLSLNAQEGKAINFEFVTLVQHPNGGPKMFALRDNRIVDVLDEYLHYEADTAPGSSGSPVLNDQFEVVALHHSGVPARDSAGKVLNTDNLPWSEDQGEALVKWIANEGVRVSRIVARARDLVQKGTPEEVLLEAAFDVSSSTPRATLGPLPAEVRTADLTDAAPGPHISAGRATWTIPLQVSIGLGDLAAGHPTIAGPGPQAAAGSTPAAAIAPSRPPTDAAPALALRRAVQAARELFKAIPGVLGVSAGFRVRAGALTDQPAIVVSVKEKLMPAALSAGGLSMMPSQLYGFPVDVQQASAEELVMSDPALRGLVVIERTPNPTYTKPPGLTLPRVKERMRVCAHVSPEHGWPVLKDFLEGTTKHLTVGMYDFGATHIRDALIASITKQRKMRLLMQFGESLGSGSKAADLTDEEMVAELQAALGARFDSRWVSVAKTGALFASAYHIKVAVRDNSAFWLSSGNWQSSNQPAVLPAANDKKGLTDLLTNYNREWHLVVEHPGLAKTFQAYIDYDYVSSSGFTPGAAVANELYEVIEPVPELEEVAKQRAIRSFTPLRLDRVIDVQAVLSPDNYAEVAHDLLASATNSIYFQNQYIHASNDPRAVEPYVSLLKIIAAKQKAGVDVRIILRGDYGFERAHVDFIKAAGINFDAIRWRAKSHTKGIVVDAARVLVGSHNWSFDGVSLNRDASLLFYDAEIARYFQKVFIYDWDNWSTTKVRIVEAKPKVASLSLPEVRELAGKGFEVRPLFRGAQ